MAAKSIIGAGILGNLIYTERQQWAIELGQWLASLVLAKHTSDQMGDQIVAPLRRQIAGKIDRILSDHLFHLTTDQLLATSNNDVIEFGSRLLDLVISKEGSAAGSLTIIGQCACSIRSTIPVANEDVVNGVVKAHLDQIEHHCPDLGIATEALGKIILQQKVEDLGTIPISKLLVQLSKPLTVLIMAPDPRDSDRLRLAEERRELGEAIRLSRLRDSVILHDVPSGRVRDITLVLDTHSPNILHFSGHGSSSGLYFENDQGEAVEVSKSALAGLLGMQKELKLVILNACYSQDQAQAIADAVGCVIGMESSILDQDSITFSREFYRALAHGRTFEEAFNRAKSALSLTSSMVIHLLTRSQ
ncbi:hypothetical protein MMC10_001714 [Thelotrema lepadinum]|nr:hypothetical protein [Thelotrema lepadinum]